MRASKMRKPRRIRTENRKRLPRLPLRRPRLHPLTFILADAASLILWAAIYTGTGWILSDQVTPAIGWAMTYNRAAMVVLMLIVLAAAWRLWKMRLHREAHRRMDPTAPA